MHATRSKQTLAWPMVLLLAAADVGACRQTIGLDAYFNAAADAGSEAGTSACGLPFGTAACAQCMSTSCCAESNACAADPSCAPFSQCFGACDTDDWACRARCFADHRPGPTGALAPLTVCSASSCASECRFSCGNVAIAAPPDAAASCEECLTSHAYCAATRACTSSVECENAGLCWARCFTSTDCPCTPSTDAGAAIYNAAGSAFYQCGPACGVGINWTCVGHVSWPGATSNGSALTVNALDVVSYQGLSGVDVSVCYAADPFCSSPSARGVTDTGGSTVLQVAPALVGHGLEAGNSVQLTSTGSVPVLYFWGFPISQPTETFFVGVGSQAEWQQTGFLGPSGSWDTSRGVVLFYANDCTPNAPGVGVQMSIDVSDPLIRTFYVHGGRQDFTATETDGTSVATGAPVGGILNVPPGLVTLTATPRSLSTPSGHATVYVRAGTITYANLKPTP